MAKVFYYPFSLISSASVRSSVKSALIETSQRKMGGKPVEYKSPHRLRKERFKSHLQAQIFPKPVSQPIVCSVPICSPFVIPSPSDPNFSAPNPLRVPSGKEKQGKFQATFILFRSLELASAIKVIVNPCIIYKQTRVR